MLQPAGGGRENERGGEESTDGKWKAKERWGWESEMVIKRVRGWRREVIAEMKFFPATWMKFLIHYYFLPSPLFELCLTVFSSPSPICTRKHRLSAPISSVIWPGKVISFTFEKGWGGIHTDSNLKWKFSRNQEGPKLKVARIFTQTHGTEAAGPRPHVLRMSAWVPWPLGAGLHGDSKSLIYDLTYQVYKTNSQLHTWLWTCAASRSAESHVYYHYFFL